MDHHGEKMPGGILKCEPCGFIHVDPLPRAREVEHYYRGFFYEKSKPEYIKQYEEDQDWWSLHYEERLGVLQDLLGPEAKKVIVDIGCGPGFFVKKAQDLGWQAVGVEPSRTACDYARYILGLKSVIHDFVDIVNYHCVPRAEAIYMHEVLEHSTNPLDLLRICYELLHPGGVLCVVVPNDFNDFQLSLSQEGKTQWWISPKEHLNYFDFASLGELLTKVGFEVCKVTATFPMELFLHLGYDYTEDAALGRNLHHRRSRFEQRLKSTDHWKLLMELYEGFASLGLGREAVFYARRPSAEPAQ